MGGGKKLFLSALLVREQDRHLSSVEWHCHDEKPDMSPEKVWLGESYVVCISFKLSNDP